MKKIISMLVLSILFIFYLNTTYAQWGVNGEDVYLKSGSAGLGVFNPEQRIHILGEKEQYIRIQTTGFNSRDVGIELVRGSQFSGTDYKIFNDGGQFKINSTINNFTNDGTTYFQLGTSGNLTLPSSTLNHFIYLNGTGNQFIRLHSTGFGGRDVGIEFLRGSEFNGTDYKVFNDGGVFKIMNALNNFSNSGSESFRISSNNVYMGFNGGRVGIGTVNPGSYLLAVNGKVKCREVKVTLTDWADFVFDENYPLMPLDQLQKYINENGHLPGIPSETEALEKGIELGNMNTLLLEKIEELTLYVLALKKENDQLKSRLDALE